MTNTGVFIEIAAKGRVNCAEYFGNKKIEKTFIDFKKLTVSRVSRVFNHRVALQSLDVDKEHKLQCLLRNKHNQV